MLLGCKVLCTATVDQVALGQVFLELLCVSASLALKHHAQKQGQAPTPGLLQASELLQASDHPGPLQRPQRGTRQ